MTPSRILGYSLIGLVLLILPARCLFDLHYFDWCCLINGVEHEDLLKSFASQIYSKKSKLFCDCYDRKMGWNSDRVVHSKPTSNTKSCRKMVANCHQRHPKENETTDFVSCLYLPKPKEDKEPPKTTAENDIFKFN